MTSGDPTPGRPAWGAPGDDPIRVLADRAPFAVIVDRIVAGPDGRSAVTEFLNEPATRMAARFLAEPPVPGSYGRPVGDLFPGLIGEEAQARALCLAGGEGTRSGVWRLRTRAGEAVVLQFHAVFLPPDRVFTEYLDVTARERLERERSDATARLRLAFDASPDGFAVVRCDTRSTPRVEQLNDAGRRLVPGFAVGAPMPPDHPLTAVLVPVLRQARDASAPIRRQVEVALAEGTVVYDLGVSRLADDQVILAFRDVTEGTRLQERVTELARLAGRARRLMYVALDSSPLGFTVYRVLRDPDGRPRSFRVEFANEPATLDGLQARDMVGLDLLDAFPQARESGIEDALVDVAERGGPRRLPIEVTDTGGDARFLEVIVSRVEDDLVAASLIDVTELRRTQSELAEARDAALAASQAKSDFLATVTHELRTPLTTMVGATEILLDSDLDDDQRTLVQQQRDGARMLLALVSDILDLSRIEAGRLELEVLDLDVPDLVERTAAMFAAAASAKGLRLVTRVDPQVPRRLRGDPVRLQQVLLNLLSNSVKFTRSGDVRVSVQATRFDDDRVTVQFRVADTGIGMPADAIRQVFRPFVQASVGTAREYGGSGLGLSIAQRLVSLMGGSIEVSSVEGEGTTVAFTVVLRRSEPCDPEQDSDAGALTDLPGSGPALLLVEDNDTNRLLISRMLASMGCRVDVAANGVEAVDAVEAVRYDLVLMDLRMPDMDGFEAVRRIRAFEAADPARSRTAILALTANATRDVVDATGRAGMDGFLAKPVGMDDLRAAIVAWTGPDRTGSGVDRS